VHFDTEDVSPFALSLGIRGVANWQTQTASPAYIRERRLAFDPDQPKDSFTQGPDDLVVIPAEPRRTMHEITADPTRLARVFALGCAPVAQEQAAPFPLAPIER